MGFWSPRSRFEPWSGSVIFVLVFKMAKRVLASGIYIMMAEWFRGVVSIFLIKQEQRDYDVS